MNSLKESISTTDINEATYYYLFGAKIYKVDIQEIWSRKYADRKKIRQERWKISLSNVPKEAINKWWKHEVVMNVRDYLDKRTEFKKVVWGMRNKAHVNSFLEHI